jgi:lipid-A-disaccharide synthase-like uncharacterized protein
MSLQDLESRNAARKEVITYLKWYFSCLGGIALVWAFSCQ